MAAYVIANVDVHDTAGYESYKQEVPATIAKYGGKYLARGGRVEVLEGENWPKRLVILEFPSLERAKEWLHSPEYAPARKRRQETATSSLVVIEGL